MCLVFPEKMSAKTKAWIALIFICIAWGTTYLAIKICVAAFPPFLMAGVRQFAAGIIILLIALTRRKRINRSRKNILRQIVIGILMITLGNGLVSWGEQYIPSGVSALICAMMPIFAVVCNLFINKTERLNGIIVLGIILGFAGVALNFKDSIAALGNSTYTAGIFITVIATATWGIGSVISRSNQPTQNPIFNSAIQVMAGGLTLLLLSPLVDNYDHIHRGDTGALLSLLYLIIIGSVAAYTAYMYALKVLPVGVVTIYAYINPLVAVILGWWWMHEPLTIYTFFSFAAIILGVYITNKGYRMNKMKAIR